MVFGFQDVPALVAGMICSQDFSSLDEVEKHLRKDGCAIFG